MGKRILLCGKSLLISGLRASLETVPDFDLALVDFQPKQIRRLIKAWKPDVLILESGLIKSAFFLSLLPDYPKLKVIGLDIEENRLQVFSGSISYQPTPEQLIQAIES